MVLMFTGLVSKFKMTVGRAVYMFNTFLAPKLELSLHYTHGPGTRKWIHDLDRMVIGAIKHAYAVSSPVQLSHSAIASLLCLILPSRLEAAVKVSKMFLRINSSDDRWGALGRTLMRAQRLSTIDATTVTTRESATESRMMRAAHLCVDKLHWSMNLRDDRRGTRKQHHCKKQ